MRRFLLSALFLLSSAVSAARLVAQDTGPVQEIAQLMALEDRREFDGALLRRDSQHPDSLVRRHAAMAMGRIGDPAALPLLLPMIADRDTQVAIEAIFSLGELGNRSAVPDLVAYLSRVTASTQRDIDVEVVTALAKLGGPDADRALGGILDRHPASMTPQDDRGTSQVLLEAWRLGNQAAIAIRLKDYIRQARGDWRRNATYSATRLRGFGDAAHALLEAAADSDALTRSYVARGLLAGVADSARIPRETFLTPLRTLANDTDAGVRINALRALASYHDSSLVALVSGRLADRDPNVAVQAATTLGTMHSARTAATIAERIQGAPNFAQRRGLLLALADVSPAQAIEVGRTFMTDTDWRNRATYAEMLAVAGAAGSPAARQQLTQMLTDPEPRVVGFVLNALAAIVPPGDSDLIGAARSRLASPDAIVRAAVLDIMGREHNAAFIPDFAEAYRRADADAIDDARLAAVRAMADIADSSASGRTAVEAALLAGNPRSNDYIVRRLIAQRFGDATLRRTWGTVGPIETGRSPEEYRDLARRYVLGEAPAPVTIETDHGNVVIQFYAADAPMTTANFIRLVGRRFFDNGRWHRVVPNFVVQDGDPRGDGSGGPGTLIRDEINRHRYVTGTVGMALSGPDTGGSQFFITLSPQPHLDGGYTVFGYVVSGWDTLSQIVQGDRIRRIFQ
ncbi:MAG TPA: peptidylprolyl isomerase [Gemmatimonadales bacterium]